MLLGLLVLGAVRYWGWLFLGPFLGLLVGLLVISTVLGADC